MSRAPKRSRADAGLGAESPLSNTDQKKPRLLSDSATHEEQNSSSAALAISCSEAMPPADIVLYDQDVAPPADPQAQAAMHPLHTGVCAHTGSSESTVSLHPSFRAPSMVLPPAPLSFAVGAHDTAQPGNDLIASGVKNSGTAPIRPPIAQLLALYTSAEDRSQVRQWLNAIGGHSLVAENPKLYETLSRAVVTSTPSDDVVITLESPWPVMEVEHTTLFIRRRVVDLLDGILARRTTSKISKLILGTPGIGKTSTGLYLLYRLGIVEKIPVVYYFRDSDESRFISIRNGVCKTSHKATPAELNEFMLKGDFVILDSAAPPASVHRMAAHVIEVSSPDYSKYAGFVRYIDKPCFLPDWNAEEVCSFYRECHKDIPLCCVEAASSIVGGNLRAIRKALLAEACASLERDHPPDDDSVHALVIANAKEMMDATSAHMSILL